MLEQGIAATNACLSQAIPSGDAAVAAACYTQHAEFMMPNNDAFAGRDDIRTFMQSVLDSGIAALRLETLALKIPGDTAWEEGFTSFIQTAARWLTRLSLLASGNATMTTGCRIEASSRPICRQTQRNCLGVGLHELRELRSTRLNGDARALEC